MAGKSESEKRRHVLKAIGALGVSGSLAGCPGIFGDGDDGNGGNDLGERVPEIVSTYWGNFGAISSALETVSQNVAKDLDELGVSMQPQPLDFTTQVGEVYNDERTTQMPVTRYGTTPSRLDPQDITQRSMAHWAGANGRANPRNYANCEYTDPAMLQQTAETEEERRELVYEAHSVFSNDAASIPVTHTLNMGAANSDQIELNGVGSSGIQLGNEHILVKSRTRSADQIVANVLDSTLNTSNYPTGGGTTIWFWAHVPHSPLFTYSPELELENVLASDYEATGEQITVELRDGTFHNGDPITAEHVKFTYDLLDTNADSYPQLTAFPLDTIEVIDDRTVEFNFTEPFLPMLTAVMPRWGILHKDTWESAMGDPEGFEMDPLVGSGPYEITNFQRGSHINLTPHDGNPWHAPEDDLFITAYRSEQALVQATLNGEHNLAVDLSASSAARIEEELGDSADVYRTPGFTSYYCAPQHNVAPTKFFEFRDAVGKAINRDRINQLAFRGENRIATFAESMLEPHPFRPPEERLYQYTDNTQGDLEAARDVLSEAGWGWDDDGNLHYPPDADLSPRWPKGEVPKAPDFPCLDGDGKWVHPDDR